MKLRILSWIFSIAGSFVAIPADAAGWDCYALIVPDFGQLLTSAEDLPFSEEAQDKFSIYRVQSDLYRLISKKKVGYTRLIRVFPDAAKLETELERFALLKEAARGTIVRVVDTKVISGGRMQITDIRGRTLSAVIDDPTVALEIKTGLWWAYEEFVANARDFYGIAVEADQIMVQSRTGHLYLYRSN